MRLATFDIDPELGEALSGASQIELIACDGPGSTAIGDAFEQSEAMLARAAADRALIGGGGEWALGAALACAKAVVPYAYLERSDAETGRYAGHARRLADVVIADPDPTGAVQAWLATSDRP